MLVRIIMQCGSSSSMQLLWNGSLSEVFFPSRAVRQGDPLSPYLFVLGMERLGHLIEAAIEDGSLESIMLSRRGPGISHLFFANDPLLFVRATVQGANTLRQVLDNFFSCSGHKVSHQKTQVTMSLNRKRRHYVPPWVLARLTIWENI